MDTAKYKKLFLTEAATHLEGIERRLLDLEKEPSDEDLIDGLFRHYHSLKGMAASMGYEPIKELSHSQEDILSGIRDNKTSATADVISTLFNSLDRLKELIERLQKDKPLDDRKGEARVKNTSPETKPRPSPKLKTALSPLRLPGMVKVDSSLFDDLLSTAGELFMILGTFKSLTQNIRSIELKDGVHTLGKAVKKLHGSIFSARMLPMEDLTAGLPRLVRDMTEKSGKSVSLKIKGADISLDRAILEDLASPLVHIIRNAIDHGIETAEQRKAAGKPPVGTITIHAYEKKQRVVILISDDGKGINTEGIRSKLLESGMNKAEALAMNRHELLMAICRPGFSTAESVTATSGRGVGMDVVRDVVDAHGGALSIDSATGRGSTITIELPRTSSIIRTLMIVSGGQEILAPISLIEKIVEIDRETQDIKDLQYNDKSIPVVDLAAEMGLAAETSKGAVLIVERDNKPGAGVRTKEKRHVGILVDDFGLEMEAYVKSLKTPLMKIWGISGVTIMGDGRPVFILDIPQVIERALPLERTLN